MELGDQLAAYFDVAADRGVLVTEVIEDSPAEKAGLQAGDVILGVAGDDVASPSDIRRAVRGHEPGETVEVRVKRRGAERLFPVTLAETSDFGMAAPVAPRPPHAFGWHGEDFVIPIPDLENLDLQMDSEEWKRFRDELREEMDGLREELRELRLKLQEDLREERDGRGD
jgi:hypothetical protein